MVFNSILLNSPTVLPIPGLPWKKNNKKYKFLTEMILKNEKPDISHASKRL